MARQEIDLTTPQPNGKMGEPTKSAWEKVNNMTAELYSSTTELYSSVGDLIDRGYISGLMLYWSNANTLAIGSGRAYVEGAGFVSLNSDISKTLSGLAANSWYHVYLFNNSGSADVEIVTTAPSVIIFGSARSKTGDTSRRYIGSIRTTTGGAMVQFQHHLVNGKITYLGANYSIKNVLYGGVSTTAATVILANIVPVFATSADISISNAATAGIAITGNSTQGLPLASGAGNSYHGYAGAGTIAAVSSHPIDTSRNIQYRYLSTPTGPGLFIDVNGYTFSR